MLTQIHAIKKASIGKMGPAYNMFYLQDENSMVVSVVTKLTWANYIRGDFVVIDDDSIIRKIKNKTLRLKVASK